MRLALLMVAAALFFIGCGTAPEAKVTGKVTYAGNAVPSGDVNFLNTENGAAAIAKIESGGFTLPQPLAPGSYAVFVTPPAPEPAAPGAPPVKPAEATAIPMRARDPKTSGVSVSLQNGPNDVTIELND